MSHTYEIINPVQLSAPVGYVHATIADPSKRMIAVSGQIGVNTSGEITAVGDLVGQFDVALANVAQIMSEAGGSVNDITRMRIYTTDITGYRNSLRKLGDVWRRRFGPSYPAMTLVGVNALFDDQALVEIEVEGWI